MIKIDNGGPKQLLPKTVERFLGYYEDEVYTYFQLSNQTPGMTIYSVTMENAYGDYWAKIMSKDELNELIRINKEGPK